MQATLVYSKRPYYDVFLCKTVLFLHSQAIVLCTKYHKSLLPIALYCQNVRYSDPLFALLHPLE